MKTASSPHRPPASLAAWKFVQFVLKREWILRRIQEGPDREEKLPHTVAARYHKLAGPVNKHSTDWFTPVQAEYAFVNTNLIMSLLLKTSSCLLLLLGKKTQMLQPARRTSAHLQPLLSHVPPTPTEPLQGHLLHLDAPPPPPTSFIRKAYLKPPD